MSELNATILATLMTQLGYEAVNNCSILNRLSNITPSGCTALRDSIQTGIQFTLELNTVLMKIGAGNAWNFVHIVITDGADTSSKCPLENLASLFLLIGQRIPKERCLTVFIGVDLESKALAELALLTTFGGDTCQMFNINRVELDSIFQKITADLIGVRREVGVGLFSAGGVAGMAVSHRDRPVYNLRKTNFAVLLNLDISGSMKGARFEALKGSVLRFLRNLDGNDLVSCLVFNDKVNLINNINPVAARPPVSKPSKPPAIAPLSTPARNPTVAANNTSTSSKKSLRSCEVF